MLLLIFSDPDMDYGVADEPEKKTPLHYLAANKDYAETLRSCKAPIMAWFDYNARFVGVFLLLFCSFVRPFVCSVARSLGR